MSEVRKYRPSNGTEGMMFYAQWCGNCERDREFHDTQQVGCSILCDTMVYDVDDPFYPDEWHEDDAGVPRCSAYRPLLTEEQKQAEAHRARELAGQLVMFGGQSTAAECTGPESGGGR